MREEEKTQKCRARAEMLKCFSRKREENRRARYYFQLNESWFRPVRVERERFTWPKRAIIRYLLAHTPTIEIYILHSELNERLMKFYASINQRCRAFEITRTDRYSRPGSARNAISPIPRTIASTIYDSKK